MYQRLKSKYTRRQWLTLCAIGSVHLGSSVCISLQAPFYPVEAEGKGASSTVYGLVFGVFELASFISSPIFGKYLKCLGEKFTLNAGIITAAVCCILFGLLDMVDSLPAFVALSFAVRIIEALGAAAALTAAFAITATVFPDSVGTTFATLEVFYGVGYIIGPTVGGFIFSIGGFQWPFIVTGSFLLIIGIVIYFILPTPEVALDVPKPRAQLMEILKVPSVLLNIFSIIAASSSMGYYAAILEPHLRDFNLTPVQIGLMFVVSGSMYAISAPLIGWFCDSGLKPKHMSAFGNALVFNGCCLIGPAPFLPLPTILWMVIVGLILHGLGLACILVSCFIDAIKSAVKSGFADDLCTYGLVSGLWASSFSLGAFIGPSVAGALYDWVGFRLGSIYILSTQAIMLLAVLFFIFAEKIHYFEDQTRKNLNMKNDLNPCQSLTNNWNPESRFVERNPCQSYGSFHSALTIVDVRGT